MNEHLKTEPKWLDCSRVNRYTRAGKDGKFIICPECNNKVHLYFTLVGQHLVVNIAMQW